MKPNYSIVTPSPSTAVLASLPSPSPRRVGELHLG